MNRNHISVGILTLGLATSAFAQANRTWVSGTGNDANACTLTSPCATFAGAYTKTATGGEIDALDPGSYGPVTIGHALTIDGGTGTGTSTLVAASGTGITVAGGKGDVVTLRNLNILGLGTGATGISVTAAGSVRVQRVRISGFTGDGVNINLGTALTFTFDESVSNDNGGSGLVATNTGDVSAVSITNSRFSGNTNGVYSQDGAKITVNDSDSFGNSVGFLAKGTSTLASIIMYRSNATSNTVAGLQSIDSPGQSVIRISKASIAFNGSALLSGGNGFIFSFGDNSITGTGAPSTILRLQ